MSEAEAPEPPEPDPEQANDPEPEPLTCVYQGCERSPEFIHREASLEAGLEVACEDHADEGAIPIDELDFTTPGRNHPHPRPEAVERLEIATHQVCWWWVKEHARDYSQGEDWGIDRESDDRTVSVVIRDGDGELLGESQLWDYKGVYALVRDTDIPDDLTETEEPPELPEWAEWVRRDPPLEHHIAGVRCLECDREQDHHYPRMPGHHRRFKTWERIRHHGDCPHASEKDIEIHEEKQLVEEIRSRPAPSVMANGAIWDEAAELRELYEQHHHGYLTEPIGDRNHKLERVLEDRLDARYPECPECGAVNWRLGEGGFPEECGDCYAFGFEDEFYEQHRRQRLRVWGWRGHGSRNRGGDDE